MMSTLVCPALIANLLRENIESKSEKVRNICIWQINKKKLSPKGICLLLYVHSAHFKCVAVKTNSEESFLEEVAETAIANSLSTSKDKAAVAHLQDRRGRLCPWRLTQTYTESESVFPSFQITLYLCFPWTKLCF